MAISRRTVLAGLGAAAASSAWLRHTFAAGPFNISILTDEISQDFGHACEVAARVEHRPLDHYVGRVPHALGLVRTLIEPHGFRDPDLLDAFPMVAGEAHQLGQERPRVALLPV